MAVASFLFGGKTGETQDTLARKRKVAEALMLKAGIAPRNVGEGLSAIGNALLYRSMMKKVEGGENALTEDANKAFDPILKAYQTSTTADTMGAAPGTAKTADVADLSGNSVFSDFMDTVKTGVSNPYALAAIAATGKAESGFDPGNANRTWSDPSESGQAGTAGGIMSWRGPRYQALAATGDMSPAGQAKFFLNEDPALIERLNGAKSVDEAQTMMNQAWRFAGYDRPGGEAANRLAAANAFLPSFQGGGEVAALDPNAAFSSVLPEQTPAQGSLSDEVAEYQMTPDYAAQFPGRQQQQGANQKVAQALMDKPESGPTMSDLLTAASNPNLSESQRGIVNALLNQKMEESNPANQIAIEKGRLELEALKNPAVKYDFITGRDGAIFRTDQGGGLEQVYGGKPDLPNDVQEYEYAKGQGYQGTYADWTMENKKAGASQVNIDQKTEGAFDKKLAEKQAEAFDTMATEGLGARADIGVINELDTLLKGQGGMLTGLAGVAAKYGLGGEGADDLQAAQALINRLVPTQRQPGSGSMSDRDVELFTRSLPNLWNTPEGNQKIISVMRGLAQYRQAQGDIAQRVMAGEINRQDATKELRALPNPLADIRTGEAGVPEGMDPEDWKFLTPEERRLFQ